MKRIKKFTILYLFIFPLFSSFLFGPLNSKNGNNINSIILNNGIGISHYEVKQSVTYQVEINFSVSQHTDAATWYFKVPRLNDRTPNSTLTPYCPPYQESSLLYNNITGYNPSEIIIGHNDRYNNTYDSYNATLLALESVKLSQKYVVKLNELQFSTIQDSDIGVYNYSDDIFQLYCNKSDAFYNRTDPNLIAASNSIVGSEVNPVKKAEKICNWVSNFLTYNNTILDEIGASYAYGNQSGDCSEFSSLMITLLRIQDVPARKVTGFVISDTASFKPQEGDIYSFTMEKGKIPTILGHAWVEYYVPDIGWIACDPTWHKITGDYFNKIDYLHFSFNIGSWFFYPPDLNCSEFSVPRIYGFGSGDWDYDYEFKVTVLETNYLSIDLLGLVIVIIIAAVLIIALTSIIITTRRKRAKLEN
jgi:transglutaminase-like putative cysteine protease